MDIPSGRGPRKRHIRRRQPLVCCVFSNLSRPDGLAELGNQTALSALERALPAEAVEKTRLAMAQAIAELRPSDETHGEE